MKITLSNLKKSIDMDTLAPNFDFELSLSIAFEDLQNIKASPEESRKFIEYVGTWVLGKINEE